MSLEYVLKSKHIILSEVINTVGKAYVLLDGKE